MPEKIEIGPNLKNAIETIAICAATVGAYYFLFGRKVKVL